MESDQLKLLARSFAPIDAVVADAGATGLKVYVDDQGAIGAVAEVLANAAKAAQGAGKGPLHFCLMDPSLPGEIELSAGRDVPISPQIKGALKSLSGVVEVQDL